MSSGEPARPDLAEIRRTIVGEDQHCECAEQYMASLLAYVETLKRRAERAEHVVAVAWIVMNFSTPPDRQQNCYFCNDLPHRSDCAWMELSEALGLAAALGGGES